MIRRIAKVWNLWNQYGELHFPRMYEVRDPPRDRQRGSSGWRVEERPDLGKIACTLGTRHSRHGHIGMLLVRLVTPPTASARK